jgi:uncharacterized protein (TIGR03435 family)
MLSRFAIPLGLAMLNSVGMQAQSQPATALQFEVASIRANKSQDWHNRQLNFSPGGRFRAINLPPLAIIAIAYNLPDQSRRLSGGPGWIRSEAYDIEATAPEGTIPPDLPANVRTGKMRLMLEALLADRFKLQIHRVVEEQPVYALVIAKKGPKLQAANVDEKSCSGDSRGAAPCHLLAGGQGHGLHGSAVSLTDVALFLSNWTDRPTIDRTGLHGLFNIQTDGWAPLSLRATPPPNAQPSAEDSALSDSGRPTLSMILDRLGLKLESQRAPVEMFSIEHIERPSAN